jgi:hypothetical protein
MLKDLGKRRPPMLILAGNADKGIGPQFHSIVGHPVSRYQDDGSMSAEHVRKMADLLKAKEVPVEFKGIPGRRPEIRRHGPKQDHDTRKTQLSRKKTLKREK